MPTFIRAFLLAGFLIAVSGTGSAQQKQATDLNWAFPAPVGNPPANFSEAPLKQVPGSAKTYDHAQVDVFDPPDWFPEEHPPMPEVVRHGRRKPVQACSYCHLASGLGHPHSDALHVIERFRRVNPNILELTLTVDDPKAYTKSMTGKKHFILSTSPMGETICSVSEMESLEKEIMDPTTKLRSK